MMISMVLENGTIIVNTDNVQKIALYSREIQFTFMGGTLERYNAGELGEEQFKNLSEKIKKTCLIGGLSGTAQKPKQKTKSTAVDSGNEVV